MLTQKCTFPNSSKVGEQNVQSKPKLKLFMTFLKLNRANSSCLDIRESIMKQMREKKQKQIEKLEQTKKFIEEDPIQSDSSP